MARIVEILIAASPNDSMIAVSSVRAVPGRGLEGDRYFNGTGTFSPHQPKPDFEITLIQLEHIEAFASRFASAFTAQDARRNLVTSGVDLNALVGKDFKVGAVRLRGMRLCEPCNFLAQRTLPEILKGLLHKGGLRAQILSEGVLQVGDPLE